MVDLDNLREYTNIYDDLVQAELIQAIRENQPINKVIDVIIDVDWNRRKIQYGMYRRGLLEPTTQDVVDNSTVDPRTHDGVPILRRTNAHELKVNHRNHTPFFNSIVGNKTGYFLGKPVSYSSEDKNNLDLLKDYIKLKDVDAVLMDAASSAVAEGEGFILLSSPEGKNDVILNTQKSFHCVVLYENQLPVYGLMYYPDLSDTSQYNAFWYDEVFVTEYAGSQGDMVVTKDPVIHLFEGVPLVEFANNTNRLSDTELTVGLQDVYDILDSDLSSEITQLRLAYLMLKGFGTFSDDENKNEALLKMFKQTGLLLADAESGVDAKFIEKNLNYQSIEYAKNDLQRRIYKHSNSYDPDMLSGIGSSVTAFQIRMMFNALEQSTIKTEVEFKRSLKYMLSLISKYNASYNKEFSFNLEDLSVNFTRNIPSNIIMDVKEAREAGYMLSQNQLNNLLPLEVDQAINREELEEEGDLMPATIVDDNMNDTTEDEAE